MCAAKRDGAPHCRPIRVVQNPWHRASNIPHPRQRKVMANTVLRSLVILIGAALAAGPTAPASAQENKPPEQQNAEANKSEAAHIAEIARTLTGPAASPECIHLGE